MNLWETEKKLIALKKENSELKAQLRALLYQAEFHVDEYRDSAQDDVRARFQGVAARFEGMANDIKKTIQKYPQIEKAG